MPAVEERMAHLEGQAGEISVRLSALEAVTRRVEQRMDRFEQRMDHFEERMNARFDRLEMEMSHQFKWLVGIQITSLLTIVATLGAIIAAVFSRT